MGFRGCAAERNEPFATHPGPVQLPPPRQLPQGTNLRDRPSRLTNRLTVTRTSHGERTQHGWRRMERRMERQLHETVLVPGLAVDTPRSGDTPRLRPAREGRDTEPSSFGVIGAHCRELARSDSCTNDFSTSAPIGRSLLWKGQSHELVSSIALLLFRSAPRPPAARRLLELRPPHGIQRCGGPSRRCNVEEGRRRSGCRRKLHRVGR